MPTTRRTTPALTAVSLSGALVLAGLGLGPASAADEASVFTGVVRTADGAVAPGARVSVGTDARGEIAVEKTDANGRYELRAVRGEYVTASWSTVDWVAKSARVTAGPGQVVRRDLVMESNRDYSITVRTGRAKATVIVKVEPTNAIMRDTGTVMVRYKKPNGRLGIIVRKVSDRRTVKVHVPRIKSGRRAVTVIYRSPVVANFKGLRRVTVR